ncbi:MAG: carbon-nitrogen hydrolase family protein [Proteobacteria bacterium]|nr:carbon-nitrogen hydrolase family protein [Pseudomonadota bacterium]MDA0896305.1 carbon-nitrogen hydrolase family protein [Pseudomonadota bacterium]MDA1244857.1 carbon-nitrogen hydrolase family protein [Pseudomonadota bacterium]
MRIAALQMVSTSSIEQNLAAAARLIASASEAGATLVVLPEVFATLEGLSPLAEVGERMLETVTYSKAHATNDDLGGQKNNQWEEEASPLQNFLSCQAAEHSLTIVGGTIPLLTRPDGSLIEDGRVRASSLVFNPRGERIARYDKIHLFDVKVNDAQSQYSESLSYEAGSELTCVEVGGLQLGLSVCYDLRFGELYRQLMARGAQLITVPAAFTAVTGAAHWEPLLRARAIENQCYVVAAAQGGRHSDTRETWGHSMIVDPWGEVLDCVATGEGIAIADIDLARVEDIRSRMPIQQQRRLS